MPFDPDAAAAPGSGIFGLSTKRADAGVVLIPVPFDATTSYGKGTARGPATIRAASAQVDLFDLRHGRIYERGIFMMPERREIRTLSSAAGKAAAPIIAAGGIGAAKGAAGKRLGAALKRVNTASERIARIVSADVTGVLKEGKIPGLVGGEHSVSFGAIRACAESVGEIGVLQIDAHMDLREAYEGFAHSHASVMHNVMSRVPGVTKLVQVGIRDFGEGELNFAKSQGERVMVHYDEQWAERLGDGAKFTHLCLEAVDALPRNVYVSFDIDGLDPSLCPHTGTPVPGGLSFHQAAILLDTLRTSGRKVVGFDLVEVAPGPGKDEWDANVGARVLYKMCGLA